MMPIALRIMRVLVVGFVLLGSGARGSAGWLPPLLVRPVADSSELPIIPSPDQLARLLPPDLQRSLELPSALATPDPFALPPPCSWVPVPCCCGAEQPGTLALSPRRVAAYRAAQQGDAVLTWNALHLDAIRIARTPAPIAARNLAIAHVAIYDAANAIEPKASVYRVRALPPAGASAAAAAASAAHQVMVALYPEQAPAFHAALAESLASIADGPSKSAGVSFGRSVADSILAWRNTDGAHVAVPYRVGALQGEWRPTPPDFAPPLLPQWPRVTPFALTDAAQFRPPGPPTRNSSEDSAALDAVRRLGALDSRARSADETSSAFFWSDGAGTSTPAGHCNQIAAALAVARRQTLAENSRLFALLNIALADAAIVAWDAKYAFRLWRPITAIRQGSEAGSSTATWTPLLATPPFPSYVSGHSTFCGAADAILSSYYGPDVHFTLGSDALPGVRRSYRSFAAAAEEAGMSRIYAGIHFPFDNRDGLAAGRALGRYVFEHFLIPSGQPVASSPDKSGGGRVIHLPGHWTRVRAEQSDLGTRPVTRTPKRVGNGRLQG